MARTRIPDLLRGQARVLFRGRTGDGERMPWRGRVYAAYFLAWSALMPVVMTVLVPALIVSAFQGENADVKRLIAAVLALLTFPIALRSGLLVIAKTSPFAFRVLGLRL
jgi:hypothetical protein